MKNKLSSNNHKRFLVAVTVSLLITSIFLIEYLFRAYKENLPIEFIYIVFSLIIACFSTVIFCVGSLSINRKPAEEKVSSLLEALGEKEKLRDNEVEDRLGNYSIESLHPSFLKSLIRHFKMGAYLNLIGVSDESKSNETGIPADRYRKSNKKEQTQLF